MIERVDLPINDFRNIYMMTSPLDPLREELEEFLYDTKLNTRDFARKTMLSEEIKANDLVEGYQENIDDILKTDKRRKNGNDFKEQRILNLYRGYKYILGEKEINKENLKELYDILSRNLLSENDLNLMGDYYRNGDVFIYYSNNTNIEPDEGIIYKDIDKYMNQLFEFINSEQNMTTMTDNYIKSQIMHFYFVYIHPYFDVNGRTSRTLSMWYLINKEVYPYVIFNRGINFDKSTYYKAILEAKKFGNITIFLKYMLENVKVELEKEFVISEIEEREKLSLLERQSLNYILSMKGLKTLKDFTKFYNYYNEKEKMIDINETIIEPLLDKKIIEITRYSKSKIYDGSNNFIFELNKKYKDEYQDKIKRLKL